MREIKFRAYHKLYKVVVDVLSIDFKSRTVRLPVETRRTDNYWWDESDWDLDDVVLIQYTGLKDKNGREIYEGDIVRHATDEGIYEVVFENGGFHVENINEYDYQTIDEYPLEIIGNIYENSDLLEEQ